MFSNDKDAEDRPPQQDRSTPTPEPAPPVPDITRQQRDIPDRDRVRYQKAEDLRHLEQRQHQRDENTDGSDQ